MNWIIYIESPYTPVIPSSMLSGVFSGLSMAANALNIHGNPSNTNMMKAPITSTRRFLFLSKHKSIIRLTSFQYTVCLINNELHCPKGLYIACNLLYFLYVSFQVIFTNWKYDNASSNVCEFNFVMKFWDNYLFWSIFTYLLHNKIKGRGVYIYNLLSCS